MKYVFIDTNIWLSLYHFTNDDLTQFEKLKDMLGKSIYLVVPQQVYDEIERNREAKIQDMLKSFELKAPKYPAFCKGYDDFLDLQKDIHNVVSRFEKFQDKIKNDSKVKQLPADKTIEVLMSVVDLIPCDKYINQAYNRYRIGNPPGKDNKYGDAINWECLLDNVPSGTDLYFISGDKDYKSLLFEDEMNPFLVKEWENKKGSKIHFYARLVDFLNKHVNEIKLKSEEAKETLIDKLYNSSNFVTTHKIIEELIKCSGWTPSQIERICAAMEDNCQVSWISTDDDVHDFYINLLANVKYEDLSDCATKRTIENFSSAYNIDRREAEQESEEEISDSLEQFNES